MNSRLWIIVVVAGALGLGAGAAVRHWLPAPETASAEATAEPAATGGGQDEAPDVVGARRPDFRLPDRSGEPRSIGDFGDRVVLLNFWATWCPPCLEEIPALDRLHQALGDQGFSVVGVALEGAEPVRAFAQKHEVGYPLLVGGREAFDIAAEYGNGRGTLPYSVVIDRSGTIRATHQGALTRDEAQALVAPWL
ncbi:TlpA family protein disulfide reductase [Halofilum ochraceum]|uniref:TlpA family protein disulfide reductase n=1 Tax=Halofilum ochraceum TaxID=1611323 RepID=UPI00082C5B99|nr:TlpA disulfide reductase family protein [Halofilum ochraceum]